MKKLVKFGLLFFLIVHLLGAMSFLAHGRRSQSPASVAQAAWTQGYIAGQQAATGDEGAAVNAVPPSYGEHGYYGHNGGYDYNSRHGMTIFPVFGLMFMCLIPLFFFGGMSMLFGKRNWRHCKRHGRGGPPWGDGRPPWAGHMGRWVQDEQPEDDDLPTEDEIEEKSPEDLE